jgi:hypothetical protein
MDVKDRESFWDELRLIQPTIDKFDDISFRIKNWFLTIFAGVAGYSIVGEERDLLWLNFLVIIIFYIYEVTYREAQGAFLKRSRKIQEYLRQDKVEDDEKSPNLDKYLLQGRKAIKQTAKGLFSRLSQPRISFVYVTALIVNALILFKWNYFFDP